MSNKNEEYLEHEMENVSDANAGMIGYHHNTPIMLSIDAMKKQVSQKH